ncbi:hypothetical protein QJS04_geneDACA001164 [Acorus gramineus]|uniref:Uncharacterized protein n=1 Tax=Acorus gramineus TaxID=55184 RepID=A0AAV9ADQ0_ACOGR|nr:hypothetical protein QJS04_geneDACA001164 [Acorus gramineus]
MHLFQLSRNSQDFRSNRECNCFYLQRYNDRSGGSITGNRRKLNWYYREKHMNYVSFDQIRLVVHSS